MFVINYRINQISLKTTELNNSNTKNNSVF